MAMVEVKNLCFAYDEALVVNDVSFSVEKGMYCTIVGHNGSGKSTIAKLISGLLEKKSGTILIDGVELNNQTIRKIRNKIGIVFQNPDNQFIGSTVQDDIAFGLENHNVPQAEMDGIIDEFSKRVGMDEYLNSEPTRLSGGQKQRVAIAGVLAMHPDILIFDEATSMLDPQGKDEIKKVIMELHKEKQLTILSITHDIDEVSKSDYVIALNNGKVVLEGTPQDVFTNEKQLHDIQLDIPFTFKLANALKAQGINIQQHLTIEGAVEELCQLRSKK